MSASPSPSASGEAKQADQIHFRFCRECSNLLYPKEDRANNRLMYTCRTCHVGELATSYCVYQNKLNSQVGDTAGVTQDVGSDPTVRLPNPSLLCLPGFCTLCGCMVTCTYCDSRSITYCDDLLNELPRANKLCPDCGENEAVFFQSQQRSAETGMKLYYVCCACGKVFM
ncbi:hypothetical protein N7468_003057 [Penicillium chermesinum]|uniref:DNA-directed RNA polymerase II subunit RPB9 n=1 Tax=Penicillium chermesinum TaxID=63820 RepID=A0A9W9P8D7_9EURO|nr:uncharacterized protein N7468_003057 [Penicillium chermesinum]KAJ5238438.1 hypothetical protein N7468_003057 [Penicillium chermesinum]KAJ6164096.1 hypothetical protein N7470_002768 [Penicillium chermesinum]